MSVRRRRTVASIPGWSPALWCLLWLLAAPLTLRAQTADPVVRGDGAAANAPPRSRVLSRLRIEGTTRLDPGLLRAAAGLAVGAPLDADTVAEAEQRITGACWRQGHRQAVATCAMEPSPEASPVRDEGAADAGVEVLCRIDEGPPLRVGSVELEGDLSPELRAALRPEHLAPGDVVATDRLEAALEAWRAALWDRGHAEARVELGSIEVEPGAGPPHARVRIQVDPGLPWRWLVRGTRRLDPARLLRWLREQPLSRGSLGRDTLDRMSQALRRAALDAGFPEARVRWRLGAPQRVVGSDGTVDRVRYLAFLMDEGRPVRVIGRRLEGPGGEPVAADGPLAELEARLDAALGDTRDGMEVSRSWRHDGTIPSTAELWDPETHARALAELTDVYRSQGWLEARLGPARLERVSGGTGDGDPTAVVTIPVVPGRRVFVESLRVEGVLPPALEWSPPAELAPGRPLSAAAVEQARSNLAVLLVGQGFAHATVEVDDIDPRPDPAMPDRAGGAVVFRVEAGPPVRVGAIELRGLGRARPDVVLDALNLRVGDLLTPTARETGVRQLLALGMFTSASIDAEGESPQAEVQTVRVDLRERPAWIADVRAGLSAADGPRLAASMTRGLIGGRGRTLVGALKLNWPIFRYLQAACPPGRPLCTMPQDPIERRISLSLILGGVVDRQALGRLDALHENVVRQAYQLGRWAVSGSIDGLGRRRIGRYDWRPVLQLETEFSEFVIRDAAAAVPDTLADRRALLLPEGTSVVVSLRPTLTVDGRDDPLLPTRGLFASGTVELARSLLAFEPGGTPFDVALVRLHGLGTAHIPLRSRGAWGLFLSVRGGRVWRAQGTRVLGTRRYFVGGTQTLRGLNEDGLVPEDVRAAYRQGLSVCRRLVSGLGCAPGAAQAPTSQGGELFGVGRVELRSGRPDGLGWSLFADAGNLWLDPTYFEPWRWRVTGGWGLRYALPIGPAALEWGVNPWRDAAVGEPLWRIHFSLGAQ